MPPVCVLAFAWFSSTVTSNDCFLAVLYEYLGPIFNAFVAQGVINERPLYYDLGLSLAAE